ncbi:MAG: peptidoglycan-binding protein [Cyanobacteria bacterium CRU_2_1]|nr:peptidoglycan-binding protein [Cyanobacteria bacterium RU_5_0]NJR57682.1 peptidoglycan-binding protein [Cyanobacteria bacterium CRU_2_1]
MKSPLNHSASAGKNPGVPPKLKSFNVLTRKLSSTVLKGILSLAVFSTILSFAPKVLALQVGDRGTDVYNLQVALGISADGIYGPQTYQAVIEYQQICGLRVDGIAGPETLSSLAAGSCLGFRPILPDLPIGPYVVVVPGDDATVLAQVRRVVPSAEIDGSNRGSFINAGGYSSRSGADDISDELKNLGIPARVEYRPTRIN